jgi:hypothetical protein
MTLDQVRTYLRRLIGTRSHREVAAEVGCSHSILSETLSGKRLPGQTILRAFAITEYRFYCVREGGCVQYQLCHQCGQGQEPNARQQP